MIGSCPECLESIRVPEGEGSDIVRCPLCSAEFELERVLRSLPPQLEIISRSSGGGLGIDVDSSEDSELSLKKAESIEGSGATPSRRYRPRKRKQVNMFVELIKVILGGVVAIPVGVLCIWWFAGKAPFGVAEKVGEYVPWIVPEKFRGKSDKSDDDNDGKNVNSSDENERQVPNKRQSPNRVLEKSPQVSGVLGIEKSIEDEDLKSKDAAKGLPEDGKAESGSGQPDKNEQKEKSDKKVADTGPDKVKSASEKKESNPKKVLDKKKAEPGQPKQDDK